MVFSREFPHSFQEALRVSRQILSSNHDLVRKNLIDVEAELIVMGAYRISTGESLTRTEFFFRMKDRISATAAEKVLLISSQRAEGKLLQHLLGYSTFLNHEYQVNAHVLIPRPETEVLVTEATKILTSAPPPILGLEVGLGSAIISIELLSVFATLRMQATELSEQATFVAELNARSILRSGAQRLNILSAQSKEEVLEPFSREGVKNADFLISNPPYLDPKNTLEVDEEVRKHEPSMALFSEDPLYFYKKIASDSVRFLRQNGYVFLEVAAERAEETRTFFQSDRWRTVLARDLNGKERILVAQLK
jgi:release factor glutamine methyltransferase